MHKPDAAAPAVTAWTRFVHTLHAYHYNSRPVDLGGLNGFGSFDVVMEAPAGGAVAVGPTRGALRFGATLTHRAAVAEATAILIRRAQNQIFSWLSSRWGRLPW